MITTTAKEHGIMFKPDMVQAIIDGRKTQTRRVVKELRCLDPERHDDDRESLRQWGEQKYGTAGDRLWVRETWCGGHGSSGQPAQGYVSYRADGEFTMPGHKWRSPIHMPRWASRLTLEITGVRVERVQEISIEDCVAEGLPRGIYQHATKSFHPCDDGNDCQLPDGRVFPHTAAFGTLWNSINVTKPGCEWEENPWVWVIDFKREGA